MGRAMLNGSGKNGHLIPGRKGPAGIAVQGDYVYWANYGSGTIARARLDGTEVTQQIVPGRDYGVLGIAVDDRHIYWTRGALDPHKGMIGRANLDGSEVDRRFIRTGGSATGLAVDSRHIYWTNYHANRDYTVSGYAIGRANLDGSHIDPRFIDTSNKLDGVAVNDRYLFWSNNGEHAIGRSNLDGTEVRQRCVATQRDPLENVPEGLAVDDRHIYWTNYPANTIARANLDGSHTKTRFIRIKGVPEGIAIADPRSPERSPTTVGGCHVTKRPLLFGPTNQSAGPYASGWGEVAPAVVSNGGASASGTVSDIHWRSWGRSVATGRGRNPTFRPHGGYYPKPVVIELRASIIRRCKPGDPRVYTRFSAREQIRPGGPMGKWFDWAPNMCRGFR